MQKKYSKKEIFAEKKRINIVIKASKAKSVRGQLLLRGTRRVGHQDEIKEKERQKAEMKRESCHSLKVPWWYYRGCWKWSEMKVKLQGTNPKCQLLTSTEAATNIFHFLFREQRSNFNPKHFCLSLFSDQRRKITDISFYPQSLLKTENKWVRCEMPQIGTQNACNSISPQFSLLYFTITHLISSTHKNWKSNIHLW